MERVISRPRWELDPTWRHGPVMGTINGAASAFATAAVADVAGVDPWWLAAGGGVAAGAATIAAARRGLSRASGLYRACCMAAAGSWATWATATTPWQADRLGALTAGALAAGLLAPAFARHDRTLTQQAERAEAIASRRGVAAEWVARLDKVCSIRGSKVVGIADWDWLVDGQPTGFSLDVDLPAGITWRHVEQFTDGLAGAAKLPRGCGVSVRPGAHRGAAVLDVATIDALAGEDGIPYPDDYSPLTVNNLIPLGPHRNGETAGGEFRRASALIIGQVDSGKTNTMQVTNAGLVRCVDTLVWHIDLNGGGMSLPWVLPWHEQPGLANPAVDWVAPTGEEASIMVRTALVIAKRRKTAYQPLMRAHNDDKIPISPEVPEIVIVLDEMAEVMGETTLWPRVRDDLAEIDRIGRAVGVRTVKCGLRATAEITGGANVKKQSATRIGMRVQDPEELIFLFGNAKGISAEEMADAGYGYLALGSSPARLFRSWRLRPTQIGEIAVAVAGRRPALDAPSMEAAGTPYKDRWNRLAPWLDSAMTGTATPAAPTPPAAAVASGDLPSATSMGDAMQGLDDARAALNRAEPEGTTLPTNGALAAQFDDIIAGWDLPAPDRAGPASPPPPGPALHARERMFELLRDTGVAGTTPTELADRLQGEGYSTTRQTVQAWLREARSRGEVWWRPGGIYIHTDHPRPDDAQ